MRNLDGVTIAIFATVVGASTPALADSFRDDFSQKKNTPQSQADAAKRMPPDVVMDSAAGPAKSPTLDKLPASQTLWSGNSFRSGLHK